MRLVLGLGQHQLHRAANTLAILCDQQRAFARRNALGHAAPEGLGAFARKRVHKTHRGVAFHAVDQHIGEFGNLRILHLMQAPQRPRCGVHRVHTGSVAITTA